MESRDIRNAVSYFAKAGLLSAMFGAAAGALSYHTMSLHMTNNMPESESLGYEQFQQSRENGAVLMGLGVGAGFFGGAMFGWNNRKRL